MIVCVRLGRANVLGGVAANGFSRMDLPKVVFIHAGTHKTGTTSIQSMLAANAPLFAQAGIGIPHTGRLVSDAAGHHNIAWELDHTPRFDPNHGTLDHLIAEVASLALPTVCVSSEEFECLAADESNLRALRDAFWSIGYESRVILYLRPQADYLESLYAQMIQGGWLIEFNDFRATIVATGRYARTEFDYDRLTKQFEAVFGSDQLRIRLYRAAAPPDDLLLEFIDIICAGRHRIDIDALQRPDRLNQKSSFDEVLEARSRQVFAAMPALAEKPQTPHARSNSEQFAPLTLLDLVEIAVRFGPHNARVNRRYGVDISGVSFERLWRELLTVLFGDRATHNRKLRLRSLRATADVPPATCR